MPAPHDLLNRDFVRNSASAAGDADADITVPAEKRQLVTAVTVQYIASADVANRLLRLELLIGGVVKAAVQTAVAITASQTVLVSFGAALPNDAAQVNGTIRIGFPEFVALAGNVIRVSAVDGEALDVFDAYVHALEEKAL